MSKRHKKDTFTVFRRLGGVLLASDFNPWQIRVYQDCFLDPFKIIGGVLVALGFVFRAISVAYFKQRAKSLPDTPAAQRQFEGRRQRALLIDALFIGMGFYLLLTH